MLDRLPDWESFLATHEWAVSVVPRLRDRVVDDPFLVATPEWVPDDGFDLAYHVRRVRLPDGGGVDDLIAIAQVMAMSPFDRARRALGSGPGRRAAGRPRGLPVEAPPQPAGRCRADPAVRHPAPRSPDARTGRAPSGGRAGTSACVAQPAREAAGRAGRGDARRAQRPCSGCRAS